MSSVKRGTLAVACLATAMLMLDVAVVNTAIPHMGIDLHVGLGALKWVIDAYTLALATTVLTLGALADRLGRRSVFASGLGIFTAASLVCATAQSVVILDVARAIQGIGGAAMFASSLALLAHAFPEARERGNAMAAYGATIGAAFAVGFVLALLRGNADGWSAPRTIATLAGAALFLAAFVVHERRARAPMLPLALFRVPAFAGAQVSAFAISASFFAMYLYATLYLQDVLGLSAIDAGLAYLPATTVIFLVSGATAQLNARVSPRAMIAGGLALVAVGLAVMTVAGAHSSWRVIQPGMLIAAVGTGLINPVLSRVALDSAPTTMSGLAAGVNDTARQTGVAVGIAALEALIRVNAVGSHRSLYVHDLRVALIAAAGVAFAGAVGAWRLLGVRDAPAAAREIATADAS